MANPQPTPITDAIALRLPQNETRSIFADESCQQYNDLLKLSKNLERSHADLQSALRELVNSLKSKDKTIDDVGDALAKAGDVLAASENPCAT